jgi:hypothetical protein
MRNFYHLTARYFLQIFPNDTIIRRMERFPHLIQAARLWSRMAFFAAAANRNLGPIANRPQVINLPHKLRVDTTPCASARPRRFPSGSRR